MHCGARARDRKYRSARSGWRALTCPNESTTPSRARMRFAVTSSSLSCSSLFIVLSQDEAHRAERAELVGVDQNAAFLDPKRVARAPQQITVGNDIFAHALV